MKEVQPKAELINYLHEPEKNVAVSARLCYSEDGADKLMEEMTDEYAEDMVKMLTDLGHCYDKETEVLTDSGFKKWSNVNKNDLIASVDPNTREFIGFEEPNELIKYKYNDKMLHIKNRKIDLKVSKEHKLYASLSRTAEKRINPNFSLVKATSETKYSKNNSKVYKKPMRMTRTAINNRNYNNHNENNYLYSLYGFFIGDGYSQGGNKLYFHLKKGRKIKYLRKLANKLDYKFKENKNNKYIIHKNNIGNEFRDMFYNNKKKKTFPNSLLKMSSKQFDYFWDGLFNSDGSDTSNNLEYFTTSKELANKIQALGAINNVPFTINKSNIKNNNTLYTLNFNTRKFPHVNDSRNNYKEYKWVDYNGYIYSASVSKGLLIVRRNNKVVLSGNSSTLEHTYFYFHIVGSKVMTHQLVRKRIGASYSQRSQRYVEEDDFDFITPPSIKENDMEDEYIEWMEKGRDFYKKLVDKGIPKEDARFVLPTIKTNIVVSMNARALLDFFRVRTCNRAQWEIRSIAKQMLSRVKKVAPSIFKNAGPPCVVDGYCPEGDMSCGRIDKIKYNDGKHIKTEEVMNQIRHQCPICEVNTSSLSELITHLNEEHDYNGDIVTNKEDGNIEYYIE